MRYRVTTVYQHPADLLALGDRARAYEYEWDGVYASDAEGVKHYVRGKLQRMLGGHFAPCILSQSCEVLDPMIPDGSGY